MFRALSIILLALLCAHFPGSLTNHFGVLPALIAAEPGVHIAWSPDSDNTDESIKFATAWTGRTDNFLALDDSWSIQQHVLRKSPKLHKLHHIFLI